jgi:hypothetical protein
LGKGLSEILPTANGLTPESHLPLRGTGHVGNGASHPGDWTALGPEQHRLIVTDLGTIAEVLNVDLCAYLYRPVGEGYRLVGTTRPEAGARPDPFALFDLMRACHPEGPHNASIGRYECTMIASSGHRSRGVLLLGKLQLPLTPTEIRLAGRLCRLGALVPALG